MEGAVDIASKIGFSKENEHVLKLWYMHNYICYFQFQGQGPSTTDTWEPPDEDCPLRDAESRKIPKLTVKVVFS